MIPSGDLSTTLQYAPFLDPDGRTRLNQLEDYEWGGIGLNNPSEGLQYQVWYAWYSNGVIFIKPLEE